MPGTTTAADLRMISERTHLWTASNQELQGFGAASSTENAAVS